jgi:hypothetical protein
MSGEKVRGPRLDIAAPRRRYDGQAEHLSDDLAHLMARSFMVPTNMGFASGVGSR